MDEREISALAVADVAAALGKLRQEPCSVCGMTGRHDVMGHFHHDRRPWPEVARQLNAEGFQDAAVLRE
jgi:hypothetical protein